MGNLVNGQWQTGSIISSDKQGQFKRQRSAFRHWITQEGDSGFKAEPHRYHLYVSYACPWASRALIFRTLKGLEEIISYSAVNPLMQENGWEFGNPNSATADPLLQSKYLYEIYQKADPKYTGKVTVPVLWDKKTNTIVNNESAEIIRMLNSEFNEFTKNKIDFYPKELQNEIDKMNDFIYTNINNGVYQCGFATQQEAYELAFDALFSALEQLERLLEKQRYLMGTKITEADWRLFTTLIRFDMVYVGHFKCNQRCLREYPNLWNYTRELYQIPGVKKTVNFEHIKQHYYQSHKMINPTGIIAKGPQLNFDEPHHRNHLEALGIDN